MNAIAQMSDDELMAIAQGNTPDVSSVSDDELMKIAGMPSKPSNDAPKAEWDAYYKATVKPREPSLLETEVISPISSALSTGLTAGVFKEGIGAIDPEMKARMFPEQKTIPGKILRGGAELTATLAGLPTRAVIGGINLAAKAAPKYILPAAKALQGTVGQKIATGAIGGAIGGASLAAENLDPKTQAAQVGIGAVTGGAFPVAAKPVEKFLSPLAQKTADLVKKNAKVYRNVLNPGKDIIQKVEVKSGKKIDDFMELAADENLILNQTAEGKLDTKAAVTALKDRKVELNAQLESALQSDPSKGFNLREIGERAKANLRKHTRNASELKTALESVDNQIADEIALHGETVDGITANRIKGGMWDVSYSPLEPNKNKISRQIGFAIKDAIEQAYPDQAIKETNKRLGDFVTLESILKKSDGNVVQRGRIGNYVGNIVGMGVGGALGSAVSPGVGTAVGSAGGAALGGAASKFLANPERITKGLPKDVSKFQKIGSAVGDTLRKKVVVGEPVDRNMPFRGQATEAEIMPEALQGIGFEKQKQIGTPIGSRKALPNLPAEKSGARNVSSQPIQIPSRVRGANSYSEGVDVIPLKGKDIPKDVPIVKKEIKESKRRTPILSNKKGQAILPSKNKDTNIGESLYNSSKGDLYDNSDVKKEISSIIGRSIPEDGSERAGRLQRISDEISLGRAKLNASKNLQKRGFVDTRGIDVSDSSKLRSVAESFNDPSVEKLQIIAVDKDGKIVFHQVGTSGSSAHASFKSFYNKPTADTLDKIGAKANVDGLYIVHNHPGSGGNFSDGDVQLINQIENAGGFKVKGHMVISDGDSTFVSKDANGKFTKESIGSRKSESKSFTSLLKDAKEVGEGNSVAVLFDADNKVIAVKKYNTLESFKNQIEADIKGTRASSYIFYDDKKLTSGFKPSSLDVPSGIITNSNSLKLGDYFRIGKKNMESIFKDKRIQSVVGGVALGAGLASKAEASDKKKTPIKRKGE